MCIIRSHSQSSPTFLLDTVALMKRRQPLADYNTSSEERCGGPLQSYHASDSDDALPPLCDSSSDYSDDSSSDSSDDESSSGGSGDKPVRDEPVRDRVTGLNSSTFSAMLAGATFDRTLELTKIIKASTSTRSGQIVRGHASYEPIKGHKVVPSSLLSCSSGTCITLLIFVAQAIA